MGGAKRVLAEARVEMEGMGLPRRLVLNFRAIVAVRYEVLVIRS